MNSIKKIHGVKTTVEHQGKRLMLAFTGPELMRAFDADSGEEVTKDYADSREELFALADANFAAGNCTLKTKRIPYWN